MREDIPAETRTNLFTRATLSLSTQGLKSEYIETAKKLNKNHLRTLIQEVSDLIVDLKYEEKIYGCLGKVCTLLDGTESQFLDPNGISIDFSRFAADLAKKERATFKKLTCEQVTQSLLELLKSVKFSPNAALVFYNSGDDFEEKATVAYNQRINLEKVRRKLERILEDPEKELSREIIKDIQQDVTFMVGILLIGYLLNYVLSEDFNEQIVDFKQDYISNND